MSPEMIAAAISGKPGVFRIPGNAGASPNNGSVLADAVDADSAPKQPQPKGTLFQRLLDGVDVQATKHGHSETLWGDDSPTGRPTIYVNDDIYQGAAKDKMVKSESLHLLKLKDPKLHAQIMASAQRDPDYMRWARDSYDIMAGRKPDPETGAYVPEEQIERRGFDDWHNISRLDQVMGGYILAQDPDMPTMKNWRRDGLPIGPELRAWLDYLDGEFRR